MFMLKITIILTFISVSTAFASNYEVDDKESNKKFQIDMQSGKKDDVRYYEAKFKRVIDAPIEAVKNSIVNFDQKCNNDLKDKRKIRDEKFKCKYFNPSQVEAVIVKDIGEQKLEENEVERFMVNRYVYNRDYYHHSDKVQVLKIGEQLKIIHTMMSTKEAKIFSPKALEKNSAMNFTQGIFTLTPKGPKQTELDYSYEMQTDHWLISKSISVSQVFDNMASSLNDLSKSILEESKIQVDSQTRLIGSSN